MKRLLLTLTFAFLIVIINAQYQLVKLFGDYIQINALGANGLRSSGKIELL